MNCFLQVKLTSCSENVNTFIIILREIQLDWACTSRVIAEYTSNYYPVSINGDSLLQQCQDLPKEVNLSINWFKENQSVLESFKRTMCLLSNVQMLSV